MIYKHVYIFIYKFCLFGFKRLVKQAEMEGIQSNVFPRMSPNPQSQVVTCSIKNWHKLHGRYLKRLQNMNTFLKLSSLIYSL